MLKLLCKGGDSMKKLFSGIMLIAILFVLYVSVIDPFVYQKAMYGGTPFMDMINNFKDKIEDLYGEDENSSGSGGSVNSGSVVPGNQGGNTTGSTPSGGTPSGGTPSGGTTGETPGGGTAKPSPEPAPTPAPTPAPGNTSGLPINYKYYTQDKSVTGLTGACLLTSFAMLITNAGRYYNSPKEYGPVDVYLANNPDATKPSDRRIISWYYVIAEGFNHKWINVSDVKTMTAAQREAKAIELLKTHPWGVIIGGEYGDGGTHYIAMRYGANGSIVFDDPVKSVGPNISSISGVYGINSWEKIRQIMTIEPNMDSNGKWKDGKYDNCLKNPGNCHVCSTQVDC